MAFEKFVKTVVGTTDKINLVLFSNDVAADDIKTIDNMGNNVFRVTYLAEKLPDAELKIAEFPVINTVDITVVAEKGKTEPTITVSDDRVVVTTATTYPAKAELGYEVTVGLSIAIDDPTTNMWGHTPVVTINKRKYALDPNMAVEVKVVEPIATEGTETGDTSGEGMTEE